MFVWRATKYDPRRRDRRGRFRAETWTSVTDIGRAFAGETLTPSEYLRVEDAYVFAVRSFVEEFDPQPTSLTVVELEAEQPPAQPPPLPLPSPSRDMDLREGAELTLPEVDATVRLALREEIWCELRHVDRLRVRFGWDYYMYVGSTEPSERAIARSRMAGLFVEPLSSFP